MNKRIAKKIVRNFDRSVPPMGRALGRVKQAHRRLGLPLPELQSKSTLNKAAPEDTGTDYSGFKVSELKAACKERGLQGYSKLKKDDLIALLGG